MFDKHKNNKKNILETVLSHTALGAMAIATLAGLGEGIEFNHAALVPVSVSTSQSAQQYEQGSNNIEATQFVCREKEEAGHRAVSYGVSMRTHPTTGTA